MKREIRDSLRNLRERVAALGHKPPRLVDLIADPDGIVREAHDEDGRALAPAELAALGLPKRVAPGQFRDAAGRPREATPQELVEFERGAARRAAGPEPRP